MVILKGIGTVLLMMILIAFIVFVILDSNHVLWEKVKKLLFPSAEEDRDLLGEKIYIAPPDGTLSPGLPVIKIYGKQGMKRGYIHTPEFRIGRGDECEVVIENPTVSEKHAVIRTEMAKDGQYYTIENCSAHSTLNVKDENLKKYIPLGYGQKFFLEGSQIFYLGDVKIEIMVPVRNQYQEGFEAGHTASSGDFHQAEQSRASQSVKHSRRKYDL